MKEEKETKSFKGSTAGKVKKLQKQYNKILVDLFDQFAAESIEEALDKNEGSFGENISDIVQCALDCLKGKVMDELGISSDASIMDVELGDIGFGIGITDSKDTDRPGIPVPFESEDGEDEDTDDSDKDEDESEEEEEEIKEHIQYFDTSIKSTDKILTKSRQNDQIAITEAYSQMYK